MDINPVILSIPIYFGLILIEWVYDLIKGKGIYRLADAYANISAGIFEQVTGVFVKIFTIGLYMIIFDNFRITEIPTTWPYLILMWLAVDFSYYWAHRWSHEINLFWLGHVVHHQSEDYNFSVALRQGALQKVFTSWIFLPMAVLGFDPTWFVIIGALNTVYQFWIHTEQINKMGWFGIVFNTPSHHRVHHGRNPKYIDKNHAGSLIIWDKMFGTFQKEEETPTYGVTKPTNHWNPVSAHIQPIADMFKDMKQVKGIKNKFLLMIKPPGWFPQENGGMRFPQEVIKEEYRKFDIKVSRSLQAYLFIHSLFLLAGTSYFLFNYENQTLTINLIWASGLIYSIVSFGLLFEAKKHSWIIEELRLVILFIISGLMVTSWMQIVLGITLIASMILIYRIKKSLFR